MVIRRCNKCFSSPWEETQISSTYLEAGRLGIDLRVYLSQSGIPGHSAPYRSYRLCSFDWWCYSSLGSWGIAVHLTLRATLEDRKSSVALQSWQLNYPTGNNLQMDSHNNYSATYPPNGEIMGVKLFVVTKLQIFLLYLFYGIFSIVI